MERIKIPDGMKAFRVSLNQVDMEFMVSEEAVEIILKEYPDAVMLSQEEMPFRTNPEVLEIGSGVKNIIKELVHSVPDKITTEFVESEIPNILFPTPNRELAGIAFRNKTVSDDKAFYARVKRARKKNKQAKKSRKKNR